MGKRQDQTDDQGSFQERKCVASLNKKAKTGRQRIAAIAAYQEGYGLTTLCPNASIQDE